MRPMLCLAIAGVLLAGCKPRAPQPGGRAHERPPQPAPSAALLPESLRVDEKAPDPKDDPVYVSFVRPLLQSHGCDAGPCHGTFKGGGLFFMTPNPRFKKDYNVVLERLDRRHPEESILIKKALARVSHAGGKNLREGSCEARRLLAWIGRRPDIACEDRPAPPPAAQQARFAREVLPALAALGCAQTNCHGAPGKGAFDLSPLSREGKPDRGQVRAMLGAFSRFAANRGVPWTNRVISAAWGEDPVHPHPVDLQSCAYRRLHGYVAEAPESTCRLDRPDPALPSMEDFQKVVLPTLARRGCAEGTCHANGLNPMPLFEVLGADRHAAVHDYLMLTARVEDLRYPERSTLVRTARNLEPHGGGQRLGGKGDCVDDMLGAWLRRAPVAACPPPKPPSKERFFAEVQGVFDKMTCSQMKCHGGGNIPHFLLTPHATDPAAMEANYQQVIRQIDYDFMPFSQIQLRMREPCAYAVVGAWIEGKPRPSCTIQDPDPAIFPKIEEKLQHRGPPARAPALPLQKT